MSRATDESEGRIADAVRLAVGALPDVVAFRNNTGVAEHAALEGKAGARRLRVDVVRYGLGKGGADFVCILAPLGRWVALEVKTPTGAATPEQLQWLALVRRMGGFACIVRSADEALAAVERARKGANA